jgi:hypothetical protein
LPVSILLERNDQMEQLLPFTGLGSHENETNGLTIQMKVALIRQKMDDIDKRKAELDRVQTYLASILAEKLTLLHSEKSRK